MIYILKNFHCIKKETLLHSEASVYFVVPKKMLHHMNFKSNNVIYFQKNNVQKSKRIHYMSGFKCCV